MRPRAPSPVALHHHEARAGHREPRAGAAGAVARTAIGAEYCTSGRRRYGSAAVSGPRRASRTASGASARPIVLAPGAPVGFTVRRPPTHARIRYHALEPPLRPERACLPCWSSVRGSDPRPTAPPRRHRPSRRLIERLGSRSPPLRARAGRLQRPKKGAGVEPRAAAAAGAAGGARASSCCP